MTPISEAARKAAERVYLRFECTQDGIGKDPFIERAAPIIQQAISSECAARDALIAELRAWIEKNRDGMRRIAEAFGSTPEEKADIGDYSILAKIPADLQGKAVVDAAELDGLRKDRERLEWLEAHHHFRPTDPTNHLIAVSAKPPVKALRAAIDSAMERARAGKEGA